MSIHDRQPAAAKPYTLAILTQLRILTRFRAKGLKVALEISPPTAAAWRSLSRVVLQHSSGL